MGTPLLYSILAGWSVWASSALAATGPAYTSDACSLRVESGDAAEIPLSATPGLTDPSLHFYDRGYCLDASGDVLEIRFVRGSDVSPRGVKGPAHGNLAIPQILRPGIRYGSIWPGIDAEYVTGSGLVQSFFYVASGADPSDITIEYGSPVSIEPDGSLSIPFADGYLSESPPIAWQNVDGKRVPVRVGFESRGNENRVGFDVGQFDPRYELIIDPTLDWVTAIASPRFEGEVPGIGRLELVNENLIALPYSVEVTQTNTSTGTTRFSDWIESIGWTTEGSPASNPTAYPGNTMGIPWDLLEFQVNGLLTFTEAGESYAIQFMARCGPDGAEIAAWNHSFCIQEDPNPLPDVFALTYLQYSSPEGPGWRVLLDEYEHNGDLDGQNVTWPSPLPNDILVDPVGGLIALTYDPPAGVFVRRFDSSGTEVFPSLTIDKSLLSASRSSSSLVLGEGGAFYGYGQVAEPPPVGVPIRAYSGGADIVVSKYDWSGVLQWHTYLGSPGTDSLSGSGRGLHVDSAGDLLVFGASDATWGAPVRSKWPNSSPDMVVAKLAADGSLIWNTFLGGPGADGALAAGTNQSGDAYIMGTSSEAWGQGPIVPFDDFFSDAGVLARIDASGTFLQHTFLSGTIPMQLAVDSGGDAYIFGRTGDNRPIWNDAIVPPPSDDIFSWFVGRLFLNEPPFLSVADLDFTEGDPPVAIDDMAIAEDARGDREFQTGAELRVGITQGAQLADEVSILTDGDFSVVGGSLNYLGSSIGLIAETSGTANDGVVTGISELVVLFNDSASNFIVQDLVRSIAYRTTTTLPSPLPKVVTFVLTDRHGLPTEEQAVVTVTPVINATTTQLTADPLAVAIGGSTRLTASVVGGPLIGGTVSFFDDGSVITDCASVLVDDGEATCLRSNLGDRTYRFSAEYSGDSNYLPSASAELVLPVPVIGGLSVGKLGSGGGVVSANVGPIDCGVVCQHVYAEGTALTLSAVADPGSFFAGWSGPDCDGTNPCSVVLNDAIVVNAVFHSESLIGGAAPQFPCGDNVVLVNQTFDSEFYECRAESRIDVGGNVSLLSNAEVRLNAPTVMLTPPVNVDLSSQLVIHSPDSNYPTDRLFFANTGSEFFPLVGAGRDGSILNFERDPLADRFTGILATDGVGNIARVGFSDTGAPRSIYLNGTVLVFSNIAGGLVDVAIVRQDAPTEILRDLDVSSLPTFPGVRNGDVQQALDTVRDGLVFASLAVDLVSAVWNPTEFAAIQSLKRGASALDEWGGLGYPLAQSVAEVGITVYNASRCLGGDPTNCLSLAIDTVKNYRVVAQFVVDGGLLEVRDALNFAYDPVPMTLVVTRPKNGDRIESYPTTIMAVVFTVEKSESGIVGVEVRCPSVGTEIGEDQFEGYLAQPGVSRRFEKFCDLPSDGDTLASVVVTASSGTGENQNQVTRFIPFEIQPSRGVKVEATSDQAVEGSATETSVIRFSRVGETASELNVQYVVSGSATAGVDHSAQTGSLVIPPLVESVDLVIEAFQDGAVDPGESVTVTLTPALPGDVPYYIVEEEESASVSIVEVGQCDQQQVQGGDEPDFRRFDLGQTSGTFEFAFDAFGIKDGFRIFYEGIVLDERPCITGQETLTLNYAGTSTFIDVEVIPNCEGTSGTGWDYLVSCPGSRVQELVGPKSMSLEQERALSRQRARARGPETQHESSAAQAKTPQSDEIIFIANFEARESGRKVLWDGGGDGISWSDASNWEDDIAPVDGDFVFILEQGAMPVVVDPEVRSLDLLRLDSNRPIEMLGGRIAIEEESSLRGSVLVDGGVFIMNGEFELLP